MTNDMLIKKTLIFAIKVFNLYSYFKDASASLAVFTKLPMLNVHPANTSSFLGYPASSNSTAYNPFLTM